ARPALRRSAEGGSSACLRLRGRFLGEAARGYEEKAGEQDTSAIYYFACHQLWLILAQSFEALRIAARFCVKLDRGRTSVHPTACACAASCVCTCGRNATTRTSLLFCRTLSMACNGWPRALRSTITSFGGPVLNPLSAFP